MLPRRLLNLGAPQKMRGFSLVELLVVLGIMLLLMSIALPLLMKVRNSARRSAMFNQLQMLATGLDAYAHDFGEAYPDVNPSVENGAFRLCSALFAPAPATQDGQDGLGFKIGTTGRVYGPYLNADNMYFGYAINSSGGWGMTPPGTVFADTDYPRLMVGDPYTGHPILYCPSLKAKPRFSAPNVYVAAQSSVVGGSGKVFYFDLDNLLGTATNSNETDFKNLVRQAGETTDTNFIARAQLIIGDSNNNGQLDNGEKLQIDAPFLLWSPGLDGIYGSVSGAAADDVVFTGMGQ